MKKLTSNNWEKVKLGNLGKVSMCKRVFKNETSNTGEIPFYKIGTFGKEPDAFISQELFDNYRRKFSFPKVGDVLLSASGTIGRKVVYDGKPAYFQDSNIIWLEHDGSKILNSFLFFLYDTIEWQTEGSTIKRLYNSILLKKTVPLPSLKEQRKIVDILSSIDQDIAKTDEIIEKTELLKNGIVAHFLSESKKWQKSKLGEIATFKNGINFSKEQRGGDGILTLDVLNMYAPSIFVDTKNLYRINVEGKNYHDYLLQNGDVLFVRSSVKRDGVGWAALYNNLNEDALFCGFLIRARLTTDTVLPEYLVHYLRAEEIRRRIITSAGQSAITNISQQSLQNFEIAIPPKNEQQKIITVLTSLDNKISAEKVSLGQLGKLKNGLMHDIFSRKVEVN